MYPLSQCHGSPHRCAASARLTGPGTLPLQPDPAPSGSECPRIVAIGRLSDEVLLNVFRYYTDASPRFWPRLVHVCRKWRHIVFSSQWALHLRLFCTPGTPVLETLDRWPALPIVMEYGGSPALDPPTPEDENNIMVALKQSDRISSISLTVTSSLRERLFAIEGPLSQLEYLVVLSQDQVGMRPTLPSTFRWCPRLRSLHFTRVIFPPLPQLLYSSKKLVDLRLHEVAHLPLEALANALSQMTQLRALSLHFLPTASLVPSSSGEYIFLPSLTHLDLRGITKYLEGYLTKIDAPRLGDIEITTLDEPIFDASSLFEFIDQTKMQHSYHRADILFSELSVSISLTQPAPTCLKLQVCYESLSRHLFSMAAVICNYFSAQPSYMEDLRITATRLSSRPDCDEQWLELIRSFRGTKWFHVAGSISTDIVLALQHFDMRCETVLPALHKLCIQEPEPCHAPLRDAVVSFMHSRRLSGRFIGVEFEQPSTNGLGGTVGPFSQQVTIEMLSDDVILDIFRHRQNASPQLWPTLTHVCRRWRLIVLGSPLALHLRLYCTHRTPILKTLGYWPPFPLVVNYETRRGRPLSGSLFGDPLVYEGEENIVAALKQSDRVSSITLTVTNSLLASLSTISEPFSKLEELALMSPGMEQLTLPTAFQWGTRLRTLHLTCITVLSLPQLLHSSTGLVDLQLDEIPDVGYFPPGAFVDALAGMTQLETLSLCFVPFSHQDALGLPPQLGKHVVLPALTSLKYQGTSKYLNTFVAEIDAPRLRDISLTFFSQSTMDTSQLGRFIERIEVQTSLSEANVQASTDLISICFSKPGAPTRIELQIFHEQLHWQLSSMTQICNHFSPFLFHVENLGIDTTCLLSGQNHMDDQWLDLIRAFGGAKVFRVAGEQRNMVDILYALRPADGVDRTDTPVLPSLRNLRIEETMPVDGPLWDAVQSFVTSRWLSGCPVEVYAREYLCRICVSIFKEQQEIKNHLLDKHSYLLVCTYCGDSEYMSGYNDRFQEHLASNHPEVARTDTLISNLALQSYSGSHGSQDIGLRALDIFGPFTKLKAPVQRGPVPMPDLFPDIPNMFNGSDDFDFPYPLEEMELWFDPSSIQDGSLETE
ncbi:hypothetical protein EDB83DRAFT_235160 [Lactarius deliciosus]|nr:hypothetical protein EDB83DRAFT_235160 [Lactarius deliciosus]